MKFVRRKARSSLLNVVVNPEEEVPLPGKAELETLEKKAEAIVNEFKRFCKALGGTLSGHPYAHPSAKPLTCTLPARARVRLEARKNPIYGPGDKIERWYMDVELMATLETGQKAWFHEKSHTFRLEGVGLSVDVVDTQHTEYWSPAFEWTKLEADGVTEIGLRTHPVNNNIELVIVGKRRW